MHCVFIVCIADFYYFVVQCVGPDSHPSGLGDQINNNLQRKDLQGPRGQAERAGCGGEQGGSACEFLLLLIPTAHRQEN